MCHRKKKRDVAVTGFPRTRCCNLNKLCQDEDTTKDSNGQPKKPKPTRKPPTTRCGECIAQRQGCDLKTVGIPYSKCKKYNKICQGLGSMEDPKALWATARPTRSEGGMLARQDDGISARPSRRDERPARARFASPELLPAPTYSAKCDNCVKYGWFCDDSRPCFMCVSNGLICNGAYQGNPYGNSPDSNSGGDNGGDFANGGLSSNWPPTNSPPRFDRADDSSRFVRGPNGPPPYRDFDNALGSALRDSPLGQSAAQRASGTGKSFGTVTEAAPSNFDESEDKLAPFTRQRMLVNQNTGFGAPFEIAFGPGRG
jgi:hypothetical protein